MRLNRFTIVISLVSLALLIGAWQSRRIHEQRQAVTRLAAQLEATRQQADEAGQRLGVLREEVEAGRRHRDAMVAQVAALGRGLAGAEALAGEDPRWLSPPSTLPDWNPESPYVWLSKELLPRLPVQPLGRDGALDPQMAEMLAVEPGRLAALNRTLTRLVAEFRTQEAAHARISEEHLPGIASAEGEKRTIVVEPLPEISADLRGQFEAALHRELGPQRAALLLETATGWMQDQLGWTDDTPGVPPPQPRTFSAARRPDGSFQITIRSGHGWMSISGPNTLSDNIPPHLRHLFTELEREPEAP